MGAVMWLSSAVSGLLTLAGLAMVVIGVAGLIEVVAAAIARWRRR